MADHTSPQVQAGHVRCRRCSKFRHTAEFVGGPYGYCLHCLETHSKAMEMMAGGAPFACQECGVTPDELLSQTAGADIRMEMHMKDAMYQFLCKACGDVYARKRLDLYGETPFAIEKQIS